MRASSVGRTYLRVLAEGRAPPNFSGANLPAARSVKTVHMNRRILIICIVQRVHALTIKI